MQALARARLERVLDPCWGAGQWATPEKPRWTKPCSEFQPFTWPWANVEAAGMVEREKEQKMNPPAPVVPPKLTLQAGLLENWDANSRPLLGAGTSTATEVCWLPKQQKRPGASRAPGAVLMWRSDTGW